MDLCESEVGDVRDCTAGKHRNIKRTVFGANLYVNRGGKSGRLRQPKEKENGTRPS